MNKILLSIFIFQFSNFCWAEKLCFKNKTEYEALKNRLPALMPEIPLVMAAQTKMLFFDVKATSSIQFDDEGRIRFYFNCTHEVDTPIESAVSICVDSNDIILTFDNGKVEKVALKSKTEVLIRDKLILKKVSQNEFTNVSKIISEKLNEVEPTSSSSGRSLSDSERSQR